jgi:hypothetical protein
MHTVSKLERSSAGSVHKAGALVLSLSVTTLIVACGSGSGGGVSSGGACASASAAEYLAQARVVFMGTMLPGRTASIDGRHILMSPARVRVTRYLKGTGPRLASVATGALPGNTANAECIEPQAGQRWKIYTSSGRMPYQTSICGGSKQMR